MATTKRKKWRRKIRRTIPSGGTRHGTSFAIPWRRSWVATAMQSRSKGILSAVDGAHVPGMMKLNLHELGCDMYSSSPHKWLQAPKGSGFLFVRDEVIDRLWNTIATEGWNDTKIRAERFQRIGSSNVPALWGLRAAVQLANEIGMARIEKRHRQTADHIVKEVVKRGAASRT